MVARSLAALLLMGLAMLSTAEPASACSCAVRSVDELSRVADAGFVGTVVGVGPAADGRWEIQFDVEAWLYEGSGDRTATVYGSPPASSCGLELPVGARSGVFVEERGGEYHGMGCATLPPDLALAQVSPPQVTQGLAELVVVAGGSPFQLVYLSREGAVLGYHAEPRRLGPSSVARCAGTDVVLFAGPGEPVWFDLGTGSEVGPAFPEVATSSIGLDAPAPRLDDMECRAPGQEAVVLERAGDDVLVRSSLGEKWIIEATQRWSSYSLAGEVVVEWGGGDGGSLALHRRDRPPVLLTSGSGRISVAVSPDRSRVAVAEDGGEGVSLLRILDLATPEVPIEVEITGHPRHVAWVDAEHVMTSTVDSGRLTATVYASDARVVGQVRGWEPLAPGVLLDGVLWGLRSGTVYAAELDDAVVVDAVALLTLPVNANEGLMVLHEPLMRSDGTEPSATPAPVTTEVASGPGGVPTTESASARVDSPAPAEDDSSSERGLTSLVVLAGVGGLIGVGSTLAVVRRRAAASGQLG